MLEIFHWMALTIPIIVQVGGNPSSSKLQLSSSSSGRASRCTRTFETRMSKEEKLAALKRMGAE
jgi:hypothetical protein